MAAVDETVTIDELKGLVGRELGRSDWFTIDQQRINDFADVTGDHQFVHVDPERASQTPLGGTIAHGLLTLSLIVHLCIEFVPKLEGTAMVLNYGFDRVRFPTPVREGSRVRAVPRLADVIPRGPKRYLMKLDVTIEIENESKPALVAEWLIFSLIGGNGD